MNDGIRRLLRNPSLGIVVPFLLVALGGARAAADSMEGALVISPAPAVDSEPEYWVIDLRTGRRTALPRSDLSRRSGHKRDTWYGSVNSSVLVRVDALGGVDLFDRRTLHRVGGFALYDLPGVRRPSFEGAVKPSPDGRLLLAYWRRSGSDDEVELAVFDRNGRVVETGLPYRYNRTDFRNAFDWLPDGSYVYLAGDILVLRMPGTKQVGSLRLRMPSNVSAVDTELAVSPDGRQLLWTLTDTTPRDGDVRHRLLYVSNLDGSGMRQLTTLTRERLLGPVDWGHVQASWSPNGESIVFWASTQRDLLGRGLAVRSMQAGCPKVFVVPMNATAAPLDGDEVPRGSPIAPLRIPGGPRTPVACGTSLIWIR